MPPPAVCVRQHAHAPPSAVDIQLLLGPVLQPTFAHTGRRQFLAGVGPSATRGRAYETVRLPLLLVEGRKQLVELGPNPARRVARRHRSGAVPSGPSPFVKGPQLFLFFFSV